MQVRTNPGCHALLKSRGPWLNPAAQNSAVCAHSCCLGPRNSSPGCTLVQCTTQQGIRQQTTPPPLLVFQPNTPLPEIVGHSSTRRPGPCSIFCCSCCRPAPKTPRPIAVCCCCDCTTAAQAQQPAFEYSGRNGLCCTRRAAPPGVCHPALVPVAPCHPGHSRHTQQHNQHAAAAAPVVLLLLRICQALSTAFPHNLLHKVLAGAPATPAQQQQRLQAPTTAHSTATH